MKQQCSASGCDRPAQYRSACLCQKHYFRLWRNGSTELKPKRKARYRICGLNGYMFIHVPGHPMASANGYAREHRVVVYDDLGPDPMSCELCGKEVTWETVHIDHINCDKTDNRRENLRPTCNGCNTQRGRKPECEYESNHKITYQGVSATPTEWARHAGVFVSGATILRRLNMGATVEEALFGPKRTHNGKVKTRPPRPPASARKNSVNLTIGGLTMTSAEWARHPNCSITDTVIRSRVRAGWPHELAAFAPPRAKYRPQT